MSTTREAHEVSKTPESKPVERQTQPAASPAAERTGGEYLHAGVFGSEELRSPGATVMRSVILRQTQNSLGNRAVQRLVLDPQAAPMRGPVSSEVHDLDGPPPGPGMPLDPAISAELSRYFGADLAGVAVHTDATAAKSAKGLRAAAYTSGRDIYFAAGKYAPSTSEGKKLLVHEISHVLQQGAGKEPSVTAWTPQGMKVSAPEDGLETEAEQVAQDFMQGGPFRERSAATPGTIRSAAPPQRLIQRDGGEGQPEPGINAVEYVEKYATTISAALNTSMAGINLNTGSPYATWIGGAPRLFMEAAWNLSPVDLLATLRPLLQPLSVETIVDRGRVLQVEVTPEGDQFTRATSKDVYFADVATELRNALTAQMNKSLQRVTPRYVARRDQLKLSLPKQTTTVPEVNPGDILPAHPMDTLVINTLCSGGKVDVDFAAFERDKPPTDLPYKIGEHRIIHFDFQGSKGAWFWLRVSTPADPSIEEVAKALYGDSAQAGRMVDASPLFGFTGVSLLLQENKDALKKLGADPDAAPSGAYPGAKAAAGGDFEPANLDPVAELSKSPLLDEGALNQAGKFSPPKDVTPGAVTENMRMSFEILDAMIPNAQRFHDDGRLVQTRDQIAAKRTALLKADPLEVRRWATQSTEQRRILGGAAAGLAQAVTQLEQMMKQSSGSGPHNLPEYLQGPLLELGMAYISAGAQSLLVGSGAAALASADERSRDFSVALLEGILQSALHNIEQAEKDKTGDKAGGNEAEFGISKLREREAELRKRLSAAREQILRDPDAVNDILKQIYADVSDLQTESGMVANMDSLDSLQKALFDSQSFWSDLWFHEYELRDNYVTAVQRWRSQWEAVYATWKKGDHEKAKTQFQFLVSQPEFRDLFVQTARYVKDAAAWAVVARLLTLVAITVFSMGIGVYVEGLAATAWGGAAAASGELSGTAATVAWVSGTAAEATVFTVLNTLMLEPEPTVKGFFWDLIWNMALFGTLRKLSMLYRGAALVKTAAAAGRTTLVAAGEMSMSYVTLTISGIARAEIERRMAGKKSLTKEEIGTIFLQSTAMFIGMAIAGRVAQPLMLEIAASGSTMGVRLRLINAQRARVSAIAEATAAGGDFTQVRQLLALDRAELQSEVDFYHQLLADPEPLQKMGYTPEQIESLRALGSQQAADLDVSVAMLDAEQTGDLYQVNPEKAPGILAAHVRAGATTTPIHFDAEGNPVTWLIHPRVGRDFRIGVKAPDSTHVALAKLRVTLSPEGQEAFDRVAGHALTPEAALEQLQGLAKSKEGFEQSVLAAAKKVPVLATVEGLYPSVRLNPQQGPWQFTTTRRETISPDGSKTVVVVTAVAFTASDGTTYSGRVTRTITMRPKATGGYDVDLTMDAAFLDTIPDKYRWVNEGIPLVAGRGTPLQTYVTLMQMRSENIGLGQVTTAHLSFIINARTCCELASLGKKFAPGVPIDKLPSRLIERTQSGNYGMTNLTQAGVKIRGMHLEGGYEVTVDEVVHNTNMDDDAKLKELGLSRTDKTMMGFDIAVDIEPPTTPAPGAGGGHP